ncbi:MAG TPA: hypothetical protein VNH46_06605, partial [Gemmatimonadales bacterium]|nr:hypothetical protein [Gemmatimonadales bacterium]
MSVRPIPQMAPFFPAAFRPRWPAILAIALSLGLHGIGLATLVRLPAGRLDAEISRILPALYLYAPDRTPG